MQSTLVQSNSTASFELSGNICSGERHVQFAEQLRALFQTSEASETKAANIVQLFETLPSPCFYIQDYATELEPNFSGLAGLYAQDARIHEGQTIREHTIRVLGQYLKYFSETKLPKPMTLEAMVTMLCLHDIGKSLPSDKNGQHDWTLRVLDYLMERNYLPLSNEQYAVIKQIVCGDPIGKLIKASLVSGPKFATKLALYEASLDGTLTWDSIQHDLIDGSEYKILGADTEINSFVGPQLPFQGAVQCISHKAKLCGMNPRDFLSLYLLFFQVDTSAYTVDSKDQFGNPGIPSLEGLYQIQDGLRKYTKSKFLLDLTKERHRLEFQGGIEGTIRNLENAFTTVG